VLTARRIHPVTSFILTLNFVFFALEVIQHYAYTKHWPQLGAIGGIRGDVLDLLGSLDLRRFRAGEYWRAVSAGFLHGGFIHLLMNCWVLWDLGKHCELLLSKWKFVVAYFISLLGGSAGSLIGMWHRGVGSSVGASGALCGLVGCLLVYAIKERHAELRDGLVRWIITILILSYLFPNVDQAGHAGGFVAGALFGLTVKDYISSDAAERWLRPGIACAALGCVGLGFAIQHYFSHR